MAKWMQQAKKADFKGIGERFQIDQVIARIIRNRDIIGDDQIEAYLRPTLDHLHDPHMLKDVKKACDILEASIQEKKKIRIIGDYDVDGVQSTYILKTALMRLGAKVDYAIPHRVEDGYGVNPSMIEKAAADGIEVIVTCDNGIAAFTAVELAKQHHITVIITDHHEVPYEEVNGSKEYKVPMADAVVNPKQQDCNYPFAGICGAVVAFKLVQVLYEQFGLPKEEAMEFLENAAFATVGDVMELREENRVIVANGLKAICHTKNVGMQALIETTGLDINKINAYQIGFVLGPCINASGRLDTATKSMELLEETKIERARERAEELVQLNEERKALTLQGTKEAFEQIDCGTIHNDKVLVIYLKDVHESIAGIIAGRIREQYHKPAIVLTCAKESEENNEKMVKGSGRSIPGYSMYEELHRCEALLEKYGGHPMAAGLSLKECNVDKLRDMLNKNVTMTEEEMEEKILIDVPMPLDYISVALVKQLELLEPFGNGNEKPIFADKNLKIAQVSYIGKNKQYLKLQLQTAYGRKMEALFFGDAAAFAKEMENAYGRSQWEAALFGRQNNISLMVTYYPQINEYHGYENLQIVVGKYCIIP